MTDTTATEPKTPHSSSIFLAFVPWVLFSLLSEHASFKAGAVSALAAAVLISIPSLLDRRPKSLELGSIAAFAAFSIAAYAADASAADDLTRYGRAIAAGLLALIALGSLLWTPFTEQYARQTVPRPLWSSPVFKRINRSLSLMWGLVFLAMVPSHLIAGAIDTQRSNLIFNWVIPVLMVVWAVKRMARLTGDDAPASSPAGSAVPISG